MTTLVGRNLPCALETSGTGQRPTSLDSKQEIYTVVGGRKAWPKQPLEMEGESGRGRVQRAVQGL